MNLVFMDTVGLLALWNASDQWHKAATTAFVAIDQNQTALVTSAFILLECGNAAARSSIREKVSQARSEWELAGMLIWPTNEDWSNGWSAYQRGEASFAGIVDHISFVTMRRLGISKHSQMIITIEQQDLKYCSDEIHL